MSIARSEPGHPVRRGVRAAGRGAGAAVFMIAVALALAGCAGGLGGGGDVGPMGGGNADGQGNFGSSMETTTVASTGGSTGGSIGTRGPSGYAETDFDCPKVEVRGGASSWQVTDKADGALRYQANLARFSRECRFTLPDMTMRVGIQGRVLLGTRGTATSLNVPIRVAVVEEGPVPKTVWTRLYMVPVQIGAEVLQVDFSMVAEEISFPRPDPGTLERYLVYVGFDSQAGEAEAARKPKPKPASPRPAAPKPVATAPKPAAPAAAPAPAAVQPAATQPVATQPVATQPAAAPRPAAASTNSQWIGSPAPSSGGFMTPTQ